MPTSLRTNRMNSLHPGETDSIHMIPVARPLVGAQELAAISRVLISGQLAQGEYVVAFERRFADLCQVQEAVAVSSGTAALHLALLAYGIGPGDEVITTPFSFAATANVIRLVGATPVFTDIEPDSYNIDARLVEAAISPRTRAILPVHLYGNPCDLPLLAALAAKHHIALIEDACQAHAATIAGKPVGSYGTGCFSFYSTKNMTMGEGGIVTTNDPAIAEHIRLLRSHGQSERYHHVIVGYNLRLTEIQAALGLIQLDKLEHFTEQRIANAAYLSDRLGDWVQTPAARPGYRHVYHQYSIRVPPDQRAHWMRTLRERGVETAVHYPCPIHRQPAYRGQFADLSLPVAEAAAREVLSLPVHPALSAAERAIVAKEVLALCR
jgi:perosamine synthetase